MPATAPTGLTVRIAGMDLAVQANRRMRDEIASWLGPWAREGAVPSPDRGAGGREGAAGFIEMAGAGGRLPADINRETGGFRIRSEGYDLLVTERDGVQRAIVRCIEGYTVTAARAALWTLAARLVLSEGGVALHASSVRTARGVIVFAGPSGAGKTSARAAFAVSDRLDPDRVLLAERDGRWVRLDVFDEYEPRSFAPGEAAELPVRAVLVPEAGAEFSFGLLRGAEAVRACLHLPPVGRRSGSFESEARPDGHGGPAEDESGVAAVSRGLARVERLVGAARVARFSWSLSDDLPALLESALSG